VRAPSAARYAEILANIRPLAEFYRANKPDVERIFMFDADYKTLLIDRKKAARFGFLFHGKQIKFAEFELLSEAQNV
jgi:hypothetical protein